MFIWLNMQGVQSDRGFVVQFTGRFTAEYREHSKVVTLEVEDWKPETGNRDGLNNPDPERIYLSIERPVLISNPNVTLRETDILEWYAPARNFH